MLGAYPDQTYYDPNRPSWLPYWVDTWGEGVKKYDQLGNFITTGNLTGGSGGAPNPQQNPTIKWLEDSAPILAIVAVGMYVVKRLL